MDLNSHAKHRRTHARPYLAHCRNGSASPPRPLNYVKMANNSLTSFRRAGERGRHRPLIAHARWDAVMSDCISILRMPVVVPASKLGDRVLRRLLGRTGRFKGSKFDRNRKSRAETKEKLELITAEIGSGSFGEFFFAQMETKIGKSIGVLIFFFL